MKDNIFLVRHDEYLFSGESDLSPLLKQATNYCHYNRVRPLHVNPTIDLILLLFGRHWNCFIREHRSKQLSVLRRHRWRNDSSFDTKFPNKLNSGQPTSAICQRRFGIKQSYPSREKQSSTFQPIQPPLNLEHRPRLGVRHH